MQRLSGDGEPGAAGGGEEGQVHAETLESVSVAIKCEIGNTLFTIAQSTCPGAVPDHRRGDGHLSVSCDVGERLLRRSS
jgi:hypothetical protein